MSNSIKMDSLFLKSMGTQANIPVSHEKESGFKISGVKAAGANSATDTILNISKEARLKLKNQLRDGGTVKRAGITSAREQFEIDALEMRYYMRGIGGSPSLGWPSVELELEWMRLDEPETYAKMQGLFEQGVASGGSKTEEGNRCYSESDEVYWDWFWRRCIGEDGWLRNPVSGKRSLVSSLEARYTDNIHDASVDVYDDSLLDENASFWRFNTKFNILLPVDLFNELETVKNFDKLSDEENTKLREKMEKIDTAVNNMKEAEINYEGDLKYLRFGVKFDNEGNAAYYANYTGCEEKNGISAGSAEELLEKLMSK